MPVPAPGSPPIGALVLESEFSDLCVEIDPQTGAPRRLWRGTDGARDGVALGCRVAILDGGEELRGPVGGLVYTGTEDVVPVGSAPVRVVEQVDAECRRFRVDTTTSRPDLWRLSWIYEIRAGWPGLSVQVEIQARSDAALARNVRLDIGVRLEDPSVWRIHSPGNPLRPGLAVDELPRPVTIASIGGVDGSTGIVALEPDDAEQTLLLWPLATSGIGLITLEPAPGGISLAWTTDIAGRPGAGGSLVAGPLYLDLLPEPFERLLRAVPDRLADLGIRSPADPPAWAVGASIYEVQVGFGVFAEGYTYGPYPEAADLFADLDRIADLGFDTLQLMPRQPFPSYNAFDYADITTSYGDEADVRRIVEACHARGMRVILDILLHGVVDHEAVDTAVSSIRSGEYADRLDEVMDDITVQDLQNPDEAHFLPLSWAAHVVNFAPYWKAGSVPRHPLRDEHPEWFCRDSAGTVTGMYSHAFDVAHPAWQRWFTDQAIALVDRLDVDGFRFDAPSYNAFHNWTPRTRSNAAVSMLGCIPLFALLRREIRARKPDALLYTEPSGALYRQAMDLTYNYDEQWLIRAVMQRGAGRPHGVRTARELCAWLAERDASIPRGSLTAHHIDSHDTFWWPHPGRKWRREQFGLEATRALVTAYMLSGGPFMTFVGAEVGIEDRVRTLHGLRRGHPAFWSGAADYRAVEVSSDDVYAVLRRDPGETGLVLVNLSDETQTFTCSVPADVVAGDTWPARTPDAFGGADLGWTLQGNRWATDVQLGPYEAAAFVVSAGAAAKGDRDDA